MEKKVKKYNMNWRVYEIILESLLHQIEENKYTRVVGLSRGGLIPGVMISHALGIPFVPLQWQTRDGLRNRDYETLMGLEDEVDSILFVDDIVDTGETIKSIKEVLPKSKWCVIAYKYQGDDIPIEYVGSMNEEYLHSWITFPWELER